MLFRSPHQCGIGILTERFGDGDYDANLNKTCVTIPEVLAPAGYGCYMSGKWHLSAAEASYRPNDAWPTRRGFEHHYGIIIGAANYYWPKTLVRDLTNIEDEARNDPDYYFTDAVSNEAVHFIERHLEQKPGRPFFQYVAYTAPHWPLHAPEENIAHYRGRFDAGWDALREERRRRMIEMGLLDPSWELTRRDPGVRAWDTLSAEEKAWQARRMEVYAAQIERMDHGIGRIIATLEQRGELDNTLIFFLADNGGCAEPLPKGDEWLRNSASARTTTRDGRPVRGGNRPDVMPGGEDTYQSYGVGWANLSNTPFRLYKHWAHEGGISTPFIVHWPEGIAGKGELRRQRGYLPDVMATILDLTGADYPAEVGGNRISPPEGVSLLPALAGRELTERMMCWEHEGNAAVRDGRWKLVKNFNASLHGADPYSGAERGDWELYDSDSDRTELRNQASAHPERVQRMKAFWEEWAKRCGVIPRETWLERCRKATEK